MDTLLRDLREGTTEQRQHAAQALRDKDLHVRVAAAESLGLVGDERAVQALVRALKKMHLAENPIHVWLHFFFKWIFLGTLVLSPLISANRITGNIELTTLGFEILLVYEIILIALVGRRYWRARHDHNRLCSAIADALMYIAERSSAPELRVAIHQLRTHAADIFHTDKHTRVALNRAAQRIEALTEHLKNLPLPAAAPAPDAATLPRTVDAPAQETERLPRVTVNE